MYRGCSECLENAGGLQYLTVIAEKIITKHPQHITFIAPAVTYFFTLIIGTGYINYAILPVIANVARMKGIRPERPLAASVTAMQQAITASPVSSATAILLNLLTPHHVELIHILMVCIPSTICGVFVATLVISKWGTPLLKDPVYLAKKDLLDREMQSDLTHSLSLKDIPRLSKISVLIFIASIILLTLLGAYPGLRPKACIHGVYKPLNMLIIIEIIMLATAGILLIVAKLTPQEIVKSNMFMGGIQAVISIFGISWLGATFFEYHLDTLQALLKEYLMQYPWLFSICLFIISVLLFSQTATISALVPVGLLLGIKASDIIGMFPAVNGLFFLPTYPLILSAIHFDKTGTTKIGKYILNHSFMLPGLIAIIVSVTGRAFLI